MLDRQASAREFANRYGADVSSMHMIAGDASHRKYYRLEMDSKSVILMDAPPDKGEDVRPFVDVSTYLINIGLSAPRIYAEDAHNGFLLIEDLGDSLFARLLTTGQADETELYEAAADVLLHLHQNQPPLLETYNSDIMSERAGLAVEWYHAGVTGSQDNALQAELESQIRTLLAPLDQQCSVLIQRDYHAENLLWLPNRSGVQNVGLLDFQDAMLGHPAYDLVSVLQDARRDVSKDIEFHVRHGFIQKSGADLSNFTQAYHVLGLQRNLRILGVFARLSLRDGKQSYVDLILRVWTHIETNLDALEISGLSGFVRDALPPPNAERLAALKMCAS